jgi:hypothetical protein
MYIRGVRGWAIGATNATKKMSIIDLNDLGFELPEQRGGHKERKAPYEGIAEVNVKVDAMDSILITVDNAENKHSNKTRRSKPKGVAYVIYTVSDANGNEIFRSIDTRTQIQVKLDPKYRGRVLRVNAAFLTHTNDTPNFSMPQTVSMPHGLDDDFQQHATELAAAKAEIAALKALLAAKKLLIINC